MAKRNKVPFWVVVVQHEVTAKDGIESVNSKVIVDARVVLASNEDQAKLIATTGTGVDLATIDLDEVEVIVSPF